MSKRYEQDLGPLAVFGALFLISVVMENALLPLATLLGALTFAGVLAYFRDWKQATWAGGVVASVVMLVGLLNLFSPGWFGSLQ